MVGYEKNDSMTTNQKLIAGCVSGVLTRFLTQPLDVVKLRHQLRKETPANPQRKWFKTTRRIFNEEGIAAFWHGHNLGQVHSVLSVTSQFYVYELCTKYAGATGTNDNKFHPIIIFFCGMIAGCCSATLVIPLEVIRVRQMIVKEQYKGIMNGAKEVYSSGGVLAFYEGLTASLLQLGPQVGLAFTVFSVVQPLFLNFLHDCDGDVCKNAPGNHHRPENLMIASTVAGAASGFVSKSVTYPFDLAKRRMQISSHKVDDRFKTPSTSQNLIRCNKLVDCLIKTYQREGFLGLYRGWKVTVYKAQLNSVIAFNTYELMCYAIREVKM